MLDPNHLNTFLAAAEMLNFSRAAERLNLTQPSVTQHIQALERHFKAELFHRSGNRLSLSEAGQALVPLARQLVAFSLRTDEVMETLKQDVQGPLSIACSTTPGKYIMPELLSSFMKQHPRVVTTCLVTPRHLAIEMLERGQVNLALSSDPNVFTNQVEFCKILSDPIVCIVSPEHPWANADQITIDDLTRVQLVMREPTAGTYRVVRQALSRHGINLETLRIILTLGTSEAVALAVEQNMGVGFVSQMVVDRVTPQRVKVVEVEGLTAHQDIFLGRHKLAPSPRVQSAFWDYINDPENFVLARFREIYGS